MVKFYDQVLPLFTPRPGDKVDSAYHFIYCDSETSHVIATDGVKLVEIPESLLEGKYQTYTNYPLYRKLLYDCHNRLMREMVYFYTTELARALDKHDPTSIFFPQIEIGKNVFHHQHLAALLQVAYIRHTVRIYLRTDDAGAATVFTVGEVKVIIMPGITSDISEIRVIDLNREGSHEQERIASAADRTQKIS